MKENNIIKKDGINPPLHLKEEPGKYIGFLIETKRIIDNDLNTGKVLEVIMPKKIEAEKLLEDLINLRVNEDNLYIMKVNENILSVKKYIIVKTGI